MGGRFEGKRHRVPPPRRGSSQAATRAPRRACRPPSHLECQPHVGLLLQAALVQEGRDELVKLQLAVTIHILGVGGWCVGGRGGGGWGWGGGRGCGVCVWGGGW